MTGWTWYCESHDSFGTGDTEDEVQHIAHAHINFYTKSKVPCRIFLKNQGDPPSGQPSGPPVSPKPMAPRASTYMERVKENFARAWQRWDESEDAKLKEHFNARKDLSELTLLHQRAEGGIVARLKKLGLLDEDIDVRRAGEILANNHEKLLKLKTYSGELKVSEITGLQSRVDRGRDSFAKFGMINPPPVPHPDLRHTSLFTCSLCNQPVIGNSCLCRNS